MSDLASSSDTSMRSPAGLPRNAFVSWTNMGMLSKVHEWGEDSHRFPSVSRLAGAGAWGRRRRRCSLTA
jgi:hypothetical protein